MSAAAPRSWGTLLAEYVALAGTDRAEASRLARQWTEDERLTLLSADDRDAHDLWMMLLSLSSHPIGEGSRFKTLLEETAQLVSRPVEAIDLEGSDALAPPWSTGIDSLYGEIQFRGFSILGGETGVGKSKIATRSAFLAAANPRVCVVYLCAELDAPTTILYAKQSTGLDPRAIVSRFPNFHPLFIPAGCSFASIVASVVDSIPDDCDRVIVYVDTLNTVIEKCDAGERDGYFKLMRRFGIWMQESRIRSQGRIGWCAVSELNKEKQVLGIKLEKWADMVIRFQAGDGDGRVNVDVLKGRYAGKGQPGKYRLLHQTCELEAL